MTIPSRLAHTRLSVSDCWSMLESITDGTFLWSPSVDQVEWSPKLLRTLGYSAEGPAGFDDIQALLHPDDVEPHARAVEHARQTATPYTILLRVRDAAGQYRHLEVHGFWTGPDVAPTETLSGFVQDVTKQAQAQETADRSAAFFRAFFDNAPAGAYVKDAQGRHVYGNALAAVMAGVPHPDLHGMTSDALFPEKTAQTMIALDRRVLEKGETVTWQGELTTPDGKHRQVFDTKFPVVDPETGARMVGGIGIDITRQHAAEKALAQAQKLDSLGQLVAGIAHDFNNTLAVLQGNLDLLAIATEPADRETCMVELLSAVDRGARLTRQLLAYGRKAVLRPTVQNMNTVLADLDRMLRRTLPETIQIEMALAGGLWNTRIDRAQVENALLNLAINARDAMPKGGLLSVKTENLRLGSDDIGLRADDLEPGRYVALSVTDTGTGMTEDIASRAFDPFFTTKPAHQGSGMGLAMVYGLLRQFGGAARIASEPNRGTTVTLYFPAVADALDDVAATAKTAERGAEHILLVEDEDTVRRTLSRQLTNLGYRVTEARAGQDGYERLLQDPSIALVLTDIVMPGPVQGPDLAEQAQALRPGLPVLFLSGYPLEAAMHGRPAASHDANLTKPVSLSELSRAIRAKLD